MLPGVCAGQTNQFLDLPKVQPTSGRVTSFVTGTFQQPSGGTDLLYINAAVGSGAASTITAGELLNQGGSGFADLAENQITFSSVSNVVAATGNFLGTGTAYAFGLTPTVAGATNLCIYAGTGATVASGVSSYNGGNAYPPVSGKSGCMTLQTQGSLPAQFGYIAALPLLTGLSQQQLLLEDTANGYVYVLLLGSAAESGGVLSGVTVSAAIPLAGADGPGPIYVGDFNGDGNTDFILNGQTGYSATVYLGNGSGGFTVKGTPYHFDANVRSMLVYDMDGASAHGVPIQDLVVEGNTGAIEIFKGNGDGTFQTISEGGTGAGSSSLNGDGGRLAAINPNTLDILTTTPIGLSLLQRQSGTLNYGLTGIYNIGSGRSSFALNDFFATGNLDLAVDSAEGVAIVAVNGNGTLATSNAYSALAPGLSATVGRFRSFANDPNASNDVVVGTGATQAQVLEGNGNGTFKTFPGVVDTNPNYQPFSSPPSGVWSNLHSGDFDGDGNLDVLYSLTGLPQPPPSGSPLAIYIQYGNGDGTFSQPGNPIGATGTAANPDGLYLESAVGDFNGDGLSDAAMSNAFFDGTGLGNVNRAGFVAGLFNPDSNNADFSQVAAGFFKVNRTSQQDVVFEQGTSFIPYKNAQDGKGKNFTAMAAIPGPGAPLYPSALLLTDVDGDGNGDLVAVYYNASGSGTAAGQVSIWWGNGDGTFNQTPLVLTLSRDYFLGAVADMNADGQPDLVLSDGYVVSILYNQGGRSFGNVLGSGLYSGEQHFLAGQGINSLSLADVNGDGVPDVVVANGGLTVANALSLIGTTPGISSLATNPSDIDTGGITVLLNSVTTKPVTGTLIASPEPSAYQATFTLTATIMPTPGVALPTGAVQFYANGVTLGNPVTVVPGATSSTATYVVPANNGYASGALPVTALYLGDAANSPVTLSDTHQIQSGATTTQIFMCIGPTAACPAPPAVANPQPPYVPALTMYYGQIWNGFVDTFANDGSALTGTVLLNDDYNGVTSTLCTLPVVGGACPASVGTTQGTSVGTNVLTATYSGDAAHTASTSGPVAITVLPDTTAQPTLVGAPNPSPLGQPVTFTATLTGNFAAPTGPVTFYLVAPGTGALTAIGTGTLAAGSGLTSTATFTTTTLPLGTDSITASYAATQNFAAATFPLITETITPSLAGSFTLSVTPTPVSVGVGYSTLLTVTVTPQNGFSQAVNLTCANLPGETSCFFDSATLANGGGTTSLVVATTAPHTCGTTQPYFLGFNGGSGAAPLALPALAGLLAAFLPRRRLDWRRRWMRGLIALVVVAAMVQMSGCGTCTDLGTRPATYTFQVTGTAAGSGAVQSQAVTITVAI